MKRLLSIVTLLVTLALTGQSQQVLWSRHFVMQPNPDPMLLNRNSGAFTNLVKNGSTVWASVYDEGASIMIQGSSIAIPAASVMVFNNQADSIAYTILNNYGNILQVIVKDELDTNAAWVVPVKRQGFNSSTPFSLNMYKIDNLGRVVKHIEYNVPFFEFITYQAVTTKDSSIVLVGSLNVDTRTTNRFDMFVAKFHVNGQLKWLNTYNNHLPDARTYSVNLVGQDSLVVTAFWRRSVFNTYLDKDGYVYDNKVIWNDPGRRLVDRMRLLPTPDGGYFLMGDVINSGLAYQTIWHKMDGNFNIQWSDSVKKAGYLSNMMISADGTFTMILTNMNGKTPGFGITDTLFYIRRRLDNTVFSLNKWTFASLGPVFPGRYEAAVLTGDNSALAVGLVRLPSHPQRTYPYLFKIFGVGEPYNPGPLSTPGVTQKTGQPYLYPNPLVSGWQVAGITPDEGTVATLTWYDTQGRMLGSQQVVPGIPQPEVPKARGLLFYRVTWQEQGLKMASGKVVVE